METVGAVEMATYNKTGKKAKLLLKVYEVDPMVCPKCNHPLKVIAVITDPHEVGKILECLKRNHAPPFDKEVTKAS